MTNKPLQDELRAVWQNQAIEGERLSLAHIQQQARDFQAHVQRRNRRQFWVLICAMLAWAVVIWLIPILLVRIGCGLLLVAVWSSFYFLHKRGAASAAPENLTGATCLAFYRRALEQRRDFMRSLWWWRILPLIPGTLLVLIGLFIAHPDRWLLPTLAAVFFALGVLTARRRLQRAERHYQREIETLNDLGKRS